MSECVHDFEIGSRYCVHCGQGAAELLYHAKARISMLEAVAEEAETIVKKFSDLTFRQLSSKLCAAGYLKEKGK